MLLSLIFISSCSSLGRQEKQTNDSVWTQEIEITHEGSRSEGSINRLFYNGNEVPGVFSLIYIGNTIYEYKPMINLCDNSGYLKISENAPPPEVQAVEVTSDEICTGWYESDSNYIKKSTPQNWIYAEKDDLKVRLSPEKIEDLIRIYRLTEISGREVMKMDLFEE